MLLIIAFILSIAVSLFSVWYSYTGWLLTVAVLIQKHGRQGAVDYLVDGKILSPKRAAKDVAASWKRNAHLICPDAFHSR